MVKAASLFNQLLHPFPRTEETAWARTGVSVDRTAREEC
jgi:hypothetical protein